MKYNLSIQLINYHSQEGILYCLENIHKELNDSGIKYVINVLDNASGDDLSLLEEKSKQNQHLKIHYSQKNLGFGGGHNYLATTCDSEYILLLNPDVKFIQEKTITQLYEFIIKNPKYAVVGPKLVNDKLKPQPFDHLPKPLINSPLYPFLWINKNKAGEVGVISGAVFLINKEKFDQVEGFDENFFMYIEDIDLCLRLDEAGEKIYYLSTVKVMHESKLTPSKVDMNMDSLEYYIKKHNGSRILGKVVKTTLNNMPVYEVIKIVAPDYCA